MNINEDKLKEYLAEIFDAGWYGIFELKDQVINEVLKKAKEEDGRTKVANCASVDSFDSRILYSGSSTTTSFTTSTSPNYVNWEIG